MAKSQFVILGDTYMSSGRFDEAYKYYLEAAIGEKDPDAIVKLAGMYLDDKYLRTDYEKAFRYFTMAYDLGLEPLS